MTTADQEAEEGIVYWLGYAGSQGMSFHVVYWYQGFLVFATEVLRVSEPYFQAQWKARTVSDCDRIEIRELLAGSLQGFFNNPFYVLTM